MLKRSIEVIVAQRSVYDIEKKVLTDGPMGGETKPRKVEFRNQIVIKSALIERKIHVFSTEKPS